MLKYQYVLEKYGFFILLFLIIFGGRFLGFLISKGMIMAVGIEKAQEIFMAFS